MIRKLFLILCLAFAVLAFGYPCLILPVGSYTANVSDGVTMSYEFKWDGKVKVKTSTKVDDKTVDNETECYYKLDWKNGVVISADETFDDSDMTLPIASIFRISTVAGDFKNPIAMWISIGVGVVDLLLILTIRKRHA